MRVQYFSNQRELELVLEKVSISCPLDIVALRGTYLRSPRSFTCYPVDGVVTLLVCAPDGSHLIYTTQNNLATVSTVDNISTMQGNVFTQIATLCAKKYSYSQNPFTLEFVAKDCTVVMQGQNGSIVYSIKSSKGSVIQNSNDIPTNLLESCIKLKSFEYKVQTDSFKKAVNVSGSPFEICKELSKYLGRCLLFTELDRSLIKSNFVISTNGCCLIDYATAKRQHEPPKAVRIQPTDFALSKNCCVSTLECSVEGLVRAKLISTFFLRKGV